MKKTIAFLYNVRHRYPDPDDSRTQLEADFDDPPAIKIMIKHLKNCGYNVLAIEADEKAYFKLFKNRKKITLAFNYSEGIYGHDREAHLPAMLEMLQIPYTGSSPLTQAIGLNKIKTKEILETHGVPVLPHQVFRTGKEKLEKNLYFPLIIKPIAQGSSAGITDASVVTNQSGLKKQVQFIIKTFREPAFVEPFLAGREFSAGMLGNPPKILPIIESDHRKLPKKYLPMDSLEVKWLFEEETKDSNLVCPAKIDQRLKEKIKKICLEVWHALEIKDWCRIDLRANQNGQLFVLEVNSPAGLIPPEVSLSSYFPLAARTAGLDYQQLLKTIINAAQKRYQT